MKTQNETRKLRLALTRILHRLTGIAEEDLTTAEKQIKKIVIEALK